MKKILLISVLICGCLVLSETDSHGFSLNISPPSFKADVEPGGSTSGTITVHNNSDNEVGILAYTQDWVYNPDGSKAFHAAGTMPFSCAKWIHLFPKKFQLAAGARMGVQYTINMPKDAKGGYYAVIFFESVPIGDNKKDEGMMVQFAGRLGTIVYLTAKGSSALNGTVESFSISPPRSNKPLELAMSFKNTGNVYIGARGTLNIIDEEGNVFGKERFGPVDTLPGDTREAKVEWLGELEEGTYYGIVTLDIGSEEPIVKETKFTVASGGVLEALSVDSSSGSPSFSVLVRNTGDLNVDACGRVGVITESGEEIEAVSLEKTLIAPGKEKELKNASQKSLPSGRYTAKAVISIGAKEFTKEEAFSIK